MKTNRRCLRCDTCNTRSLSDNAWECLDCGAKWTGDEKYAFRLDKPKAGKTYYCAHCGKKNLTTPECGNCKKTCFNEFGPKNMTEMKCFNCNSQQVSKIESGVPLVTLYYVCDKCGSSWGANVLGAKKIAEIRGKTPTDNPIPLTTTSKFKPGDIIPSYVTDSFTIFSVKKYDPLSCKINEVVVCYLFDDPMRPLVLKNGRVADLETALNIMDEYQEHLLPAGGEKFEDDPAIVQVLAKAHERCGELVAISNIRKYYKVFGYITQKQYKCLCNLANASPSPVKHEPVETTVEISGSATLDAKKLGDGIFSIMFGDDKGKPSIAPNSPNQAFVNPEFVDKAFTTNELDFELAKNGIDIPPDVLNPPKKISLKEILDKKKAEIEKAIKVEQSLPPTGLYTPIFPHGTDIGGKDPEGGLFEPKKEKSPPSVKPKRRIYRIEEDEENQS